MRKKLLLFGGTFNPVHNGHRFILKTVQDFLNPDKTIVIPTNMTANKDNSHNALPIDRFNMCTLAFGDLDNTMVSDIEISRPGVSYTVDTLFKIKSLYPDFDLYFIVGADMFMNFCSWKNPQKILEYASLCVLLRENISYDLLSSQKLHLENLFNYAKIILIDSPTVDVSSTMIRNLIKNQGDVDGLLYPGVKDYIKLHNLYL